MEVTICAVGSFCSSGITQQTGGVGKKKLHWPDFKELKEAPENFNTTIKMTNNNQDWCKN